MGEKTIYPAAKRASPTGKAAPPIVVQQGPFWASSGEKDT